MVDEYYKDLYIFSDDEETLEDIDNKSKELSRGFRDFSKHKRRPGGKGSLGSIES